MNIALHSVHLLSQMERTQEHFLVELKVSCLEKTGDFQFHRLDKLPDFSQRFCLGVFLLRPLQFFHHLAQVAGPVNKHFVTNPNAQRVGEFNAHDAFIAIQIEAAFLHERTGLQQPLLQFGVNAANFGGKVIPGKLKEHGEHHKGSGGLHSGYRIDPLA
jgi:hypothetical protein